MQARVDVVDGLPFANSSEIVDRLCRDPKLPGTFLFRGAF
ncbi:hypothetical protein A4W95_00619 [Treponema pallidum subsp. pallidum]|nr:hypothetical protein A4W95_00619 [Treponema pallidum subsp. pallidum]